MKTSNKPKLYLVSSCLVGLPTRYDGKITKANSGCMKKLQHAVWIPVCPEQLGGLPTPREPADIIAGDGKDVLDGKARVITRNGNDRTAEFIRGAKLVLHIARSQNVDAVILKARSPSCAVNNSTGVTAALLQKHGFKVLEF